MSLEGFGGMIRFCESFFCMGFGVDVDVFLILV